MLCGDLEGSGGGVRHRAPGRGDVYIQVADSLCCTAETNTVL